MGSPCLFTRQRGEKVGYFYWLCVKNSNHLHTELSLGYLRGAKFYLESKASFIDISSIALFKLFLIAWLWEYTQLGTIFRKKIVFHYQTFFRLQICSLLDCP